MLKTWMWWWTWIYQMRRFGTFWHTELQVYGSFFFFFSIAGAFRTVSYHRRRTSTEVAARRALARWVGGPWKEMAGTALFNKNMKNLWYKKHQETYKNNKTYDSPNNKHQQTYKNKDWTHIPEKLENTSKKIWKNKEGDTWLTQGWQKMLIKIQPSLRMAQSHHGMKLGWMVSLVFEGEEEGTLQFDHFFHWRTVSF